MKKHLILSWFAPLLAAMSRFFFSLRYRIVIQGLKELEKEDYSERGMIFLPNHPAQIDPVILMLLLWKKFRPRPLVIDYLFYFKGIQWVMNFVRALPIPNLEIAANKWKFKRIKKIFHEVGESLNRGDHFLIYPSGGLKHTGEELLGGASFIADLLQTNPDTQIVLVRMTGLWGSTFSRAITGQVPDLTKTTWQGIKILFKNLLFFAPRREVRVDFSKPPADFPVGGDRLQVNHYLEQWYNRYPEQGAEPLKLVSFYFWKKKFPEITAVTKVGKPQTSTEIPEEIAKDVITRIGELCQKPTDEIARNHLLAADLGFDSLDTANLYFYLDERYDIGGITPGEFETVDDVLLIAAGMKEPEEKPEKGFAPRTPWPEKVHRKGVSLPEGKTVFEAFLRSCDQRGKEKACADLTSGMMSYKKMKIAALILSKKIAELPEKNVGVLLPSSAAAYLTIFAVMLANKVPVMLNWTAGVRALDHSADLAELKTVITSARFLDTLGEGDLGVIEDEFLFLEDLKRSTTFSEKVKAFFTSSHTALHSLRKVTEDDTAVILFTSGTESLPKGVPLTHKNLLSNQKSALSCVEILSQDVLLGALPPFHSFGFNVTGILPILSGLRVCYSPDPTDGFRLAKEIAQWDVTFFCSAPSFIRMLFQVATKEQLQSVRLFVAGAEKTPAELFEKVKEINPDAEMIEGYGITECGPIVTLARPGKPPIGVGEPLPGTELCFINTETGEPAEEGEICIRSESVFNRYLETQLDPFITLDGKKWYRSGDRGHIDPSGNLILSGRLKRFIKIGGEMVSLGGIEDDLLRIAKEKKWGDGIEEGPLLALSSIENGKEKTIIVLFSTFPIAQEEVNIALKKLGYGRIVKIGRVQQVEQIPVTGTGKTHYRLLDEMAEGK